MNTHRYFIQISFFGKNYCGWQIQKNAVSVQEILDKKLSVLFREKISTTGCGRTDTGVHAKEFFAHFDLNKKITDEKLIVHRLNGMLPQDIAVQKIFEVEADAHARFDAVSRTYEYQMYFKKNPFLKDFAAGVFYGIDIEKMKEAAMVLKEYSDFSCFSKSRTQVKTNICKIKHVEFFNRNQMLVFKITADRFLRGMVRAIVGTLLKVGKGEIDLKQFRKIIEGKNRQQAGASVDACGLYLTEVKYGFDIKA